VKKAKIAHSETKETTLDMRVNRLLYERKPLAVRNNTHFPLKPECGRNNYVFVSSGFFHEIVQALFLYLLLSSRLPIDLVSSISQQSNQGLN